MPNTFSSWKRFNLLTGKMLPYGDKHFLCSSKRKVTEHGFLIAIFHPDIGNVWLWEEQINAGMFESGLALKVKKVTSHHSSGINHEKEESSIPSSAVPVLLMVSEEQITWVRKDYVPRWIVLFGSLGWYLCRKAILFFIFNNMKSLIPFETKYSLGVTLVMPAK